MKLNLWKIFINIDLIKIFLLVDCVWGDWEYDVCSVECGGGTQPMVRIKTQEAMFGGQECEGEAYAEQACNEQPCPGKGLFLSFLI